MLFGEGILALLILAFWIWAIFDCIATDGSLCRNLPKVVWLILVILLPTIGSLAWLLLGRPLRAGWQPGSTQSGPSRRPLGIEDHPRYSATSPGISDRRSAELDAQLAQWEAEQARAMPPHPAPDAGRTLDEWEADLDRREAELARREAELREQNAEGRDADDA